MGEKGWTLRLESGPHERRNCPVSVALPEGFPAEDGVILRSKSSPLSLKVQVLDGQIWTVLPYQAKGESSEWEVMDAPWPAESIGLLSASLSEDKRVRVGQGEEDWFRYDARGQEARPFFHPLFAPGPVPVTRGFRKDEVTDHIHHRSMWVSHGDVNGTNNWSDEPGHGRTECRSVAGLVSGFCVAGFATDSVWKAQDGAELLQEELLVRAYAASDGFRIMDVTVKLTALGQPVQFGDTKEGGILSVRVLPSMEARHSGQITNAQGGINEAETWGKRAVWCDYTGWVPGQRVGLCLMDHPSNLRHPTYWHVRDYGLMTANPFGVSHFEGDPQKRGDWTLPAGEACAFRYRVLIHRGGVENVSMTDRYYDWVSPGEGDLDRGSIFVRVAASSPTRLPGKDFTISAVVITLNEAHRIRDCLEGLAWCDEIVLVDAFSADETAAVAEGLGARVFQRAWDGFGGQKNYGIEQAQGDWVFVVEADERVSEALAQEIVERVPSAHEDGFRVPRLNLFLGEAVRHSDLYPDLQLRLFRRGKGRYVALHPPHESVQVDGRVGRLEHPMVHRSYETVEDFVQKMNRYTQEASEDMVKRGAKVGSSSLFFRPLGRWLRVYVVKQGFLDGHRGVMLAGLYAGYVFVKYAKAWALSRGVGGHVEDPMDAGA